MNDQAADAEETPERARQTGESRGDEKMPACFDLAARQNDGNTTGTTKGLNTLTGKEKLIAALNRREGPVPFDLGSSPVTGIHCLALERLRDHYGLEKRPVTVIEPFQMLGRVDGDLREALGVDTVPLWGPYNLFGSREGSYREWKTPWGQTVLFPDNLGLHEEAGCAYVHAEGDTGFPPAGQMPGSGYFFDAIPRQPKEVDDDELVLEDNLEEFGPVSKDSLRYISEAKAKLPPSYGALGNFGGTGLGDIALVTAPMLKQPKGIRDIEEWYISTVTRTGFLSELFSRQVDIALGNLELLRQAVGDAIQVILICGADFGTQNGPFCSAEQFRLLYAPHYRRVNDWIHAHTPWKTFKHCCGSIWPLIGEFIDVGFDVLNPVQWNAKNMGAKELKREFGRDIAFWGGGVDTQHTLQFGAPREVAAQVLELCRIFGKDGGYVFNAVHNIQATVPAENIAAMAEAFQSYNR